MKVKKLFGKESAKLFAHQVAQTARQREGEEKK